MTFQDINNSLLKELTEEMNGAEMYHEIGIALKDLDCADCIPMFDIAKDEMIHAKWIHDYLIEEGVQIPQDTENRFQGFLKAHK